jgi:thioredoxin reductase
MNMMVFPDLPVAVIGAGPVGLSAAAHLVARGIAPLILERGMSVGATLLEWGHVRVFSPWTYNIDPAARSLLEQTDWVAPDPAGLPTGAELVRDYLTPLAALPAIAPSLRLGAEVTAISRQGHDKVSNDGRKDSPFVIDYEDAEGEHRVLAWAVIDASGTWTRPNPIGVDGLAIPGERKAAGRIAYGIPDVAGIERSGYAGKRILVVGGGHSAINAALALLGLQEEAPDTKVLWALRRNRIDKLLGGGLNDQLPERGALGLAAKKAIDEGRLEMLAPFSAERIEEKGQNLEVTARLNGKRGILTVDRIIVATGFRPDLSFLTELRVELDPAIEAPPALAPLIDPNFHSCGTVPPHGIAELAHPEPGFTIVGSKSYGRAPTFLMATGYEQVRSVVAELAGDHAAAREVQLVLPETGVCSGGLTFGDGAGSASSGCCGGPAPKELAACCAADAEAKAAGQGGCGCGANGSPASAAEIAMAAGK